MRKLLIASLVVGLLAAFAVPGLSQSTIPPQDPEICDLSFDVNVLKNKNITIDKNVEKNFEYNLNVESFQAFFPLQLAEVEAFKCDQNEGNAADVRELVSADYIINSFNGFIGIAQVNQAAGLLNNQGNILAAGFTDKSGDQITWAVAMVEAAVEKTNIDNALAVNTVVTLDSIASSFSGFIGLAQVNQASGILNNQNNVVVIAKNLNTIGLMAENDTFLSMQNTTNSVQLRNVQTTAKIDTSFNGFQGAAQVNQAPGMLNNQTNIISVAHAGGP